MKRTTVGLKGVLGPEEAARPGLCTRMGEVARECLVSLRVTAGEVGSRTSPRLQSPSYLAVRSQPGLCPPPAALGGTCGQDARCLSDLGLRPLPSAGRVPTGNS